MKDPMQDGAGGVLLHHWKTDYRIAHFPQMLYNCRELSDIPETLTMISKGNRAPIEGQVKDHRREAARLRLLARNATTGAIKARLLEQAQQHDWLTSAEPQKTVSEES